MYNEHVETDLYLLLIIGTKFVGKGLLTKCDDNISYNNYSCLKQGKMIDWYEIIKTSFLLFDTPHILTMFFLSHSCNEAITAERLVCLSSS